MPDQPPVCCICGGPLRFWGQHPDEPWAYGNNPDPLCEQETDRCCDTCNDIEVIPARIKIMQGYPIPTQKDN